MNYLAKFHAKQATFTFSYKNVHYCSLPRLCYVPNHLKRSFIDESRSNKHLVKFWGDLVNYKPQKRGMNDSSFLFIRVHSKHIDELKFVTFDS